MKSFKKGYYFSGDINSILAEIIGILLGDGSISQDKKGKFHLFICFNKKETDYLNYVKEMFETYFSSYKFGIANAKSEYLVYNTSVQIGSFLIEKGLQSGNKKHNNVNIPSWIFENNNFIIKMLRGLFDTDGCVYCKYDNYAQIQFKFAGTNLIADTKKALEILGFTPTKIMKDINKKSDAWKIYLNRQEEVEKFMCLIDPKNPKNWQRYENIKKNGSAGI